DHDAALAVIAATEVDGADARRRGCGGGCAAFRGSGGGGRGRGGGGGRGGGRRGGRGRRCAIARIHGHVHAVAVDAHVVRGQLRQLDDHARAPVGLGGGHGADR